MAYMAGDNNLTEDMLEALWQFRDRLAVENVANGHELPPILAQLDPKGLGIPTQRFAFLSRSKRKREDLDDFAVEAPDGGSDFNEINTGHPGALSGFIQWAAADTKKQSDGEVLGTCEADRYALILSGHGSGALGERLLSDSCPEDALSIQELDEALADGRRLVELTKGQSWKPRYQKIQLNRWKKAEEARLKKGEDPSPLDFRFDILGLDACFMSMVEVCYEIREHARFVVGSEGFEPELGWPYERILEEIGDKEAREVAIRIVNEYVDHYASYEKAAGRAVDLAAIETAGLQCLKRPLRRLANCLRVALDQRSSVLQKREARKDEWAALEDQLVLSHWEAQSYKFQQYVDLVDFCERLRERMGGVDESGKSEQLEELKPREWGLNKLEELEPDELKRKTALACSKVIAAVEASVVLSRCCGWQYQHSHGLSIYLPWNEVAEEYHDLQLAIDTGWGKFLELYVEATCREKRDEFKRYTWRLRRQEAADEEALAFLNRHGPRVGRHGPRVGRHGPRVGRHGPRVGRYEDAKHGPRVGRFGVDADGSMKNFPIVYGEASSGSSKEEGP